MPRREKLSAGEKVELVRQCLRGEISISEAGRRAGANRETVRQWIIRYEAEGAAGFLPNERNRKYSPEAKLQAVAEYLSGKGSQVEISRKYGLRSKRQL